MTPLEMITEWRQGCSCAGPLNPEECPACTVGLIEALETRLRAPEEPQFRLIAERAALDIAHHDWGKVAQIRERIEAAMYAARAATTPSRWERLLRRLGAR
jgi:hypothetical protein